MTQPQNVKWKIDKRQLAQKAVRDIAGKKLDEFAEHILGESNKIVPLEEGDLERSGSVETDFHKLQSAISYDEPYAIVQHEDMSLKHDPGRKAKFLESTIKEQGPKMAEFIGKGVREVLG